MKSSDGKDYGNNECIDKEYGGEKDFDNREGLSGNLPNKTST